MLDLIFASHLHILLLRMKKTQVPATQYNLQKPMDEEVMESSEQCCGYLSFNVDTF